MEKVLATIHKESARGVSLQKIRIRPRSCHKNVRRWDHPAWTV